MMNAKRCSYFGCTLCVTVVLGLGCRGQHTSRGQHTTGTPRVEEKSPVFEAMQRRDYEEAFSLLRRNKKWIGVAEEGGYTPLHLAARDGHLEVVDWLLNNGADVEALTDVNHLTPLYVAVDADGADVVERLLRAGPDLSRRFGGETVLQLAALRCNGPESATWKEISALCIAHGAEYDLVSAIRLDDLDRVRAILSEDASAAGAGLANPLHAAAELGKSEICALLLEHGAEVGDSQHAQLVCDAITYPKVVKLLLTSGVDPSESVRLPHMRTGAWNIGDRAQFLHYAAKAGAVESAELLVARGADLDAQDDQGQTSLHIAVLYRRLAMVEWLLDSGASEIVCKMGRRPVDMLDVHPPYGVEKTADARIAELFEPSP